MRIYPNLINPVIDAVEEIFEGQRYADKVIGTLLKSNHKWGSRDRAFIASSIYEIVRWKRYFAYIIGQDQQPADYKKLAGIYWLLKGFDVSDFDLPTRTSIEKRRTLAEKIFPVKASIPDWLDRRGREELGETWEKEMSALNKEAFLVLRVNTLKGDPRTAIRKLEEEGLYAVQDSQVPEALVAEEKKNIFRFQAFRDGLVEVQDRSSQMVAHFMQVEPGMRVVDACAGAGGKSLHIAALLKNKGRLLSLDVEEWKLEELRKRARRAGISIIETRNITSSKVIRKLKETADRVLLDVPCSGLGVLRRNPDAKWKLSPEFIDEVRKAQADILNRYSNMVKPGGKLIYATCSILPSENQWQVERFLKEHAETFTLEEEQIVSPSESGFDGFYMARLVRKKI